MNPEALSFANGALSVGAQPTKIRKILQDKFGSNLISKDLINMKQKLTGNLEDDWSNAVRFLDSLQQDPNNVVKVLHDTAIFVQLEKQRELYKMYGKV
ncbi:Uncharacterized protein APZ42_028143, partial [Daphnia magna]